MVFLGKSHIFVVILGFKVRRIEIEERVRTVILLDEFLEIFIFDNNISQSGGCRFDQRKVVPHIVRLCAE